MIATGSHVDSQTPGGRYDGALGIVAAVAAVRALKEQVGRPRRTLEVVSLCEEEALALPLRELLGLARDHAARPARASRRGARRRRRLDRRGDGGGRARPGSGSRRRGATTSTRSSSCHIEQGPRLEDAGYAGRHRHRRSPASRHYVVELGGRSDHAGARPMIGGAIRCRAWRRSCSRRDRQRARAGPAGGDDGRPHDRRAEPARGRARPRHGSRSTPATRTRPSRSGCFAAARGAVRRVADARGLDLATRVALDLPPAPCDPATVATFEAAAAEQGDARADDAQRRRPRHAADGEDRAGRRWSSSAARTVAATRRRSSRAPGRRRRHPRARSRSAPARLLTAGRRGTVFRVGDVVEPVGGVSVVVDLNTARGGP